MLPTASLAPLPTPLIADEPSVPASEVQAVVKSPRGYSSRYQSLELWRGAACMMLVLYHTSSYVPASFHWRDLASWSFADAVVKAANLSWIGVPIFFVVSGYCIAASVGARPDRPYSMKSYFGRRFWRIYPPLWFASAWAFAATWLIGACWPSLHHACVQLPRFEEWSFWNWLGNLTATESWQHHATGSTSHYLMKNTWTLCYEEQFYAVVGMVLLMSRRRFVAAAVLLGVVTLACRHVGRWLHVDQSGWFFEGHWLLFAAGILLHHQLTRTARWEAWSIRVTFVAGMIYAFLDRRFTSDSAQAHLDEYIFVACAFALLLGALRPADSWLTKCRLTWPLQWCGKRSYSIYLTHFSVVVALSCFLAQLGVATPSEWLATTLPMSIVAALALGWLFHRLVERHFINAPA
jgi:peptidoglycan/LPS O-acetylase OafA/YrhL